MGEGIPNTNAYLVHEVNKLQELVQVYPKGQKALETLLTWFVTIQKNLCNSLFQ